MSTVVVESFPLPFELLTEGQEFKQPLLCEHVFVKAGNYRAFTFTRTDRKVYVQVDPKDIVIIRKDLYR